MGISLWSIEGVPMRVTWVNPMGISLWIENECPYQFDLNVISEKAPMFSWMNVPIKVTWNNPMGKSLWSIESVPMKVTWVNPMRKSLSKWLDLMRFEWIEVNRVKWSEMSEWMELTWNNPMRKSLWSVEGEPYQSDLSESVNECPYQNEWNRWDLNEMKWIEVNRGKMSELMDLMRSTLWKSPYGR